MLIKLWVAQGFIKSSYKNECLEDVGFAYCQELLRRSFIQEEKKDEFGKIKTYKMHDLMNELAISVAGKRSTIVDPDQETFDENPRHISFNFGIDLSQWKIPKIPKSMRKATKMRTSLFLGPSFQISSTEVKSLCSTIISNFKYLRMLSLNALGIRSLRNCLKKLKHLRYLDLSGNSVDRLPNWIVGLVSLETLDLKRCFSLKELPRDIKKMVNLRHLVLEDCYQPKAMPHGMGELTCLRTLDKFVLNKDGAGLGELSRLTELRGNLEIGYLGHGRDHLSSLYDGAILKEKHLDSLRLEWSMIDYEDVRTTRESNVFTLLEAVQPHSNVKQLSVIFYSGLRFPYWLSALINISHLTLGRCLALQHLPPLDHFPFLRFLHLESMHSLEFIMISTPTSTWPSTFYPSLKTIVLAGCPNLKGWLRVPISGSSCTSSTGVMPPFSCLSTLEVRSCPKLTSMPLYPNLDSLMLCNFSWDVLPWVSLPEGICHLSSLNELVVENCRNFASLLEGICNMTSLHSLSISDCPNLAYLPQGISHLDSLKDLRIEKCPIVKERYMKETGEYWPNIAHIPHVVILCRKFRAR